MPQSVSRFVWYELMTSDTDAARRFYEPVIGWMARDDASTGQPYTLFSADGVPVAGMLPMTAELAARGIRPHWTGYLGVPDIDAALDRIRAAGGAVHFGPQDVSGVGRLAVAGDPQGAVFSLLQPQAGMSGPPPVPGFASGHAGWRELHAEASGTAFDFYAELFGWTKGQAVDMGALGTYQTFHTGEIWAGGIMKRQPHTPHPFWLYYFNVDSASAAAARITAEGGHVLNGPQPVPGGSWVVQAADPQGAMFAVVSMAE